MPGTRLEIERGELARPVGIQLRVLREALHVETVPPGEREAIRPQARLRSGGEAGDDIPLPGLRGVEQIVVLHARDRQRALEVEVRLRGRRARQDDPCQDPRPHRRTSTDRKSTRLNSSHTVISYAVFCLK